MGDSLDPAAPAGGPAELLGLEALRLDAGDGGPEAPPTPPPDAEALRQGALRPPGPPPPAPRPPPPAAQPSTQETLDFVRGFLAQYGLVHHMEGYNALLRTGLSQILSQHFALDATWTNERAAAAGGAGAIRAFRVRVNFQDVEVGFPETHDFNTGDVVRLLPAEARRTRQTYAGALYVATALRVTALRADGAPDEELAVSVPRLSLGGFPVMVMSERCHLRGCDRRTLAELQEDPSERGGYFIVGGAEMVVAMSDNVLYNHPHIHLRVTPQELARIDYISQPGDVFENSSQLLVRFYRDGRLQVTIFSTKFDRLEMPLVLLYRLLGMTSDRQVVEGLAGADLGAEGLTQDLLSILDGAFRLADAAWLPLLREVDQGRLVQQVALLVVQHATNRRRAADPAAEAARLAGELLGYLDAAVLPHMGQGPAARWVKLKYLSVIVREMLLTHLGASNPTDRHHYGNKRMHGPGASLAKVVKTLTNSTLVRPLLARLRHVLAHKDWRDVTPALLLAEARGEISKCALGAALADFMKNSERDPTKATAGSTQPIFNRLACQALERKNPLNTLAGLRAVVARANRANKGSQAALEIRKVHPSATGYVCPLHSPDTGENVGMRRQLAVTAGVTGAGDAGLLGARLMADPAVRPVNEVPDRELAGMSRVAVNGRWLGCVPLGEVHAFARRYREGRRRGELDPLTSVYLDPVHLNLYFWLDAGRLVRPLLLVANNREEYDRAARAGRPVPFEQGLVLDRELLGALRRGALPFEELVRRGAAEYVSPDEQSNCLLCPGADALGAARGDPCRQYTHCEVPQAVLGITTLAAPYGCHTQPVRDTYCTNHTRQAAGLYCLSYPHRQGNNNFLLYSPELPLAHTLASRYVPPAGANAIIAVKVHGGNNQEDSAILNRASVERGLLAGAFFRTVRRALERDEQFRAPNPADTRRMRQAPGCYEGLADGAVRPGRVVRRDDVLVGVVAKLAPGAGGERYAYEDRSEVYGGAEPAVVVQVYRASHPADQIVVCLRHDRPLALGDKMSTRSGNKSIAAQMLPQGCMPYTEDGLTPDIITNPTSFPTRLAIGQLIEQDRGLVGAARGASEDATMFLPPDLDRTRQELAELGFRANGKSRMFDATTGLPFDAAIFVGPVHLLRLLKFVVDDAQAAGGWTPTDPLTGQPVQGKAHSGGLRLGEMENWCLAAHGAMANLHEKTLTDSDGRTGYVCRRCGDMAALNPAHDTYRCAACGERADLAAVSTCKSSQLLRERLRASGVGVTLGLRARTFQEPGASPFALPGAPAPPERAA